MILYQDHIMLVLFAWALFSAQVFLTFSFIIIKIDTFQIVNVVVSNLFFLKISFQCRLLVFDQFQSNVWSILNRLCWNLYFWVFCNLDSWLKAFWVFFLLKSHVEVCLWCVSQSFDFSNSHRSFLKLNDIPSSLEIEFTKLLQLKTLFLILLYNLYVMVGI